MNEKQDKDTRTTQPSEEVGCSVLLADLIEQWESRVETAECLAHEAHQNGNIETKNRCKTKAGTIRAMIHELKRELRNDLS